jgi:hypothetical protein
VKRDGIEVLQPGERATQRQKVLAKAPSTQDPKWRSVAPFALAVTVVAPSSDVSWHVKVRARDAQDAISWATLFSTVGDAQIEEGPNDHQARWRHTTNRPGSLGRSECCDLGNVTIGPSCRVMFGAQVIAEGGINMHRLRVHHHGERRSQKFRAPFAEYCQQLPYRPERSRCRLHC